VTCIVEIGKYVLGFCSNQDICLVSGFYLVNPHLIACDYLQKEFWVGLKPVMKVLACVDMIFLLLLTLQVGLEYGGNSVHVQIVV
jgi:hypothetical protein